MNNEFLDIQRFDELEKLEQSGIDPAEVNDEELAQSLAIIQLLKEDAEEVVMPRSVEFRHQVIEKLEKRRRPSWIGGVFTLAAAIFVGAIILRPTANGPDPVISIDAQMLDQAMATNARASIVDYLESTEQLLISIRDYDAVCSDDQVTIAPEKEMAHELLLKQKQFASQMNRPEFMQARKLFEQIEPILVDVNSLDICTDPDEVDFINESVTEYHILNKVRLMAQEIKVS